MVATASSEAVSMSMSTRKLLTRLVTCARCDRRHSAFRKNVSSVQANFAFESL
jgi:hypothetical protein